MANSYPRRDQARGLWKINDITKNIKDEGTYPNGSTRALFHGGAVPSRTNIVEQLTVETTGNATDYGDLLTNIGLVGAVSSLTRAVYGGGSEPSYVNTIGYKDLSSAGNYSDFGDLTVARGYVSAASNETRAVWGGRNSTWY